MSLHSSLKTSPSGLNQHRNVLTRAERVEQLAEEGEFDLASDSPLGMRKVAHRAVKVAKKEKKPQDAEGGELIEGAEGAVDGTEGEAASGEGAEEANGD